MEEDGTCLLDVINDPDALGAFLTSDNQNGGTAKQEVENMDTMADEIEASSSSSKPSYPDFLSMAMAEAELEPDFGDLDQDTFIGATLNPSEMGGLPEQRSSAVTLESLVEEDNFNANNANVKEHGEDFTSDEGDVQKGREDGMRPHETSASAKTALSAVQRLISQSSQPLQHGELTPDIPTQKMIHYTAEDHPLGKLFSANLSSVPSDRNTVDGSKAQPVSIQVPHMLTTSSGIGNNQQSIFQELPNQQQMASQVLGTLPQKVMQSGKQQLSPPSSSQELGIQPSSKGIPLSSQIQTVSNQATQQQQQQQAGLQQVLLGQSPQIQGAGNMQQLVLGPVQPQIIGANVIGGQANIIPQGQLGTPVLQLHRSQPQLRPKIVLKQGNMVYDGSGTGGVKAVGQSTAMKQIQLVLNSQAVLGQVPGNFVSLNGQIVQQPQQQQNLLGSSQVFIQNPPSVPPHQTAKVKAALIPNVSSTSQPVITVSASEGNIIVLTTPLAPSTVTQSSPAQKASTSTVTSSHTGVSSQVPGSSGSAVTQGKQPKGKQSKTKPKTRKPQPRSSSSKGSITSAVTTVTTSLAGSKSKNIQSLGTIPSIQTSSPLPVTSSASSLSVSSGTPPTSSVPEVLNSTNQSISQFEQGSGTSLNSSHYLQTSRSNAQSIGNVPNASRPADPAPVISHQASTVHYRPRRALPKQQVGKDLGLQQLVQDLRAQGDNERLRSLNQLRQLLQQDPQASQQLQELMKNKFNVSKPEVSVKKVPVSSNDVTKPPNVYLQPQPANSLPFQTSNKLFSSSSPSTGLVLGPVFTNKSDVSSTTSTVATSVSSALQVAKPANSDLLTSSGTKDASRPSLEPSKSFLSNGGQPAGKNSSLVNSGINLDFLDIQKVTQASEQGSAIQSSLASRILSSQPHSSGSNSSLTSILQTSPKMAVGIGSSLPVDVSSVNSASSNSSFLSSVASSSGLALSSPQYTFKTTTASNSSGTDLILSPNKTLVTSAELQETVKGLANRSENFVTQSRDIPSSQAAYKLGSSKDVQEDSKSGLRAIIEKDSPSDVSVSNQSTAAAATVQVSSNSVTMQPQNSQLSPNLAAIQRSSQLYALCTQTRDQINIRAQQQLQQIQARIQQLLSRQARTDQENLQLQQLLQFRQRVVLKAKAQRAHLEQQMKIFQQNQQARGLVKESQPSGSTSLSSSGSGTLTTSAASDVASVTSKSVNSNFPPQDPQKAFGAFAAMLKGQSQGSADKSKTVSPVSVEVARSSPQSISPASSGGPVQEQIQNALITSTTTKQDSPNQPRGEKHKTTESEKKPASKKMKMESNSPLSQSLNVSASSISGGDSSQVVKPKSQENLLLGKSLPAGQLHLLHGGLQGSGTQPTPLSKYQANSQRYHQIMRMLEEKLKSMSPAQQKQFLTQYQPVLQKLTQEGQKMLSLKQQVDSANSLNLSSIKVESPSAQRKSTQGNNSKESKSPKRGNSKSTPTLMQLISGGGGEVLTKMEEQKVKLPSRTELFSQQLGKDQKRVTHAEIKEDFSSRKDAVERLLAFHVCQDNTPTVDHLDKFDEAFEDHSQQLLEKKDEMLAKYRYLLLKESMRKGPSAEMVMLDRMVLQDERMNFEYEKQLSNNPETQSRLLAIIKPHQSKKQRFLSAAYESHTPVTPKQESLLPPKKRSHVETSPTVKPLETKPPHVSPEIPIKEPQITKNDFKTKITIKIPKQSYQPALSPAPSSGDTIHSSVSSPDLKSPKSEAGSEAGAPSSSSPLKTDISSPRVRLRRHSTLQALLMSDSPLDVSLEDLKGKKRPVAKKQSPNPSAVPEKTVTKEVDKAGKVKKNSKDWLTNGKGGKGSSFSEDALSVFDFEDDVLSSSTKDKLMLRTGTASPFEPMDMLQDTLQDEMNSTINSILGLQKTSPREKSEQPQQHPTVAGVAGGNLRETLPSAVFESHSNDDDFYDSVDTLSKFTSFANMGQPQSVQPSATGVSATDGNDAVASLQAELDIMMEGDDSLLPRTEEGKPPDPDLEAAVNSILF